MNTFRRLLSIANTILVLAGLLLIFFDWEDGVNVMVGLIGVFVGVFNSYLLWRD